MTEYMVIDEVFHSHRPVPIPKAELENYRRVMQQSARQFGKMLDAARESFHNFHTASVDFNLFLTEAQREHQVMLERRKTYRKYRDACLHGERQFYIAYAVEVKEKVRH